jgi:hypothetical protein
MMSAIRMLVAGVGAAAALAAQQPLFRTMPTPGVRHYVYQVLQTINGTTQKGYRSEFDLVVTDGAVFADVHNSAELDHGAWKSVVPDQACRAEMNGTDTRLARVKLYPLEASAMRDLGSSFLATCAPGAVFFPLTDILNVVIIPLSSQFRASELRNVGESLPFPSFTAAFDRAGEAIRESSPGGETRLAALNRRRAILDWLPRSADLTTIEHSMHPTLTLQGTEQWAFRVEVDRRTGVIERAATTQDEINLTIVGAPQQVAPVRISRVVTIERRPE